MNVDEFEFSQFVFVMTEDVKLEMNLKLSKNINGKIENC